MLAQDVSTYEINMEAKEQKKKEVKDLTSLGENAINELELKVDMAKKDDVQQLSLILVELLSYPNTEIADIHANAMRLGNFDLQKPVSNRNDTSSSLVEEKQGSKICPCCGFIKQTATIDMGTSFDSIKNMGVSTYLYFSIYKKLAILLLILTVIYSVFALITNYIASRNGTLANSKTSVDYISISLSSKQTNDIPINRTYYFIQCWLGVATIIVWIFTLAGMKFQEIKSIQEYDNDTISCSDYSIVMEGIPLDVTKDELQKQLDKFYQGLNPDSIPIKWRKPYKIAKLNVGKPFYLHEESFKDEQLENLTKQLEETKQKLINLIIERQSSHSFSTSKTQRNALYQNFKALNKKKTDKLQKMSENIKQSLKQQPADEITTAFVTLQSNIARIYFERLHEPSIFGRIRSICGKTQDKFWYEKDGNLFKLDIRRAPEPQDIIWTNLGQKDCTAYLKKIFTFTATLLLLGICFAIVYGLSRAQQDAGGSRPISIAISITISVVNVMLGQIIRRLTVFQKDYTETYRQASLAIKSVLAQMINTILIPIITAYYVKNKNFYYENGLVDNIFMLSISTIIIPPILLFVNPYRIVMSIYRCYMSTPNNKLSQNQKQYNILQEGVQFEVGYQSIYPVSTFMFVCFYVSLQPIISVVAMLGYLMMYWVEKYSLFNRYRRPVPGMDFVNNAVYRMISFGPIVYTFGSLTWANFSPNGIPPEAIIPNLIALGVSVILFCLPFNSIIIAACLGDTAQKATNFDDDRIFMPSEYDRSNPSTQADGFEDYKKYMEKKKEQIKNLNKEQQAEFAKKMMINAQRGQLMNQARAQHTQNFNFFQPTYNYFQPQPAAYGYAPYGPPAMPFMGYMPFNPMGSVAYGGYAPVQAPPMMPAPPVIVNVPQQQPMVRPQQPQMNQGFNNHPQSNPINSFIQNVQPVQQGGVNYNPFSQNISVNQVNPQVNNNAFNNPAYNPFNSGNANNAHFGGNYQQGRRW